MRIVNALLCVLLVACGVTTGDLRQEIANGNCETDVESGTCQCWGSPIIFDLAGDGIHLSSAAGGVMFPLRGRNELWAWTQGGSDDAWLVRDANGDGRIVGSEMFGDGTLQGVGTPNGFAALATLDGNQDGAITPADVAYASLRLWRDTNHDGVSQAAEMVGLDRYGISSISTTAVTDRTVDAHGNQFRLRGSTVAAAPVSQVIYDVWLKRGDAAPFVAGRGTNTTLYRCDAWAWFEMYETDLNSYVRVPGMADSSTLGGNGANECYGMGGAIHRRHTGIDVTGASVDETWNYVTQSALSSSAVTAVTQAVGFVRDASYAGRGPYGTCMFGRNPPVSLYAYDGTSYDPTQNHGTFYWRCNALISLPPPDSCGI